MPPDNRPNFILFNPDEMRAESLACYGHPLSITPNMDALAAEGVRFDQCHVQHPVCTPSRASFMTGWYPHVRGHRTLWHCLRPDEPNLLRDMKQAGYEVRWWGKNDLLSAESFAGSVTQAESRPGPRSGPNPYAPEDPRYFSFLYEPYRGPVEEHGDWANVQGAIDFLRSGPQRPFLAYLPISFPHCPYSAPPRWYDAIDPDALPPLRPADLPDKPDFHPLIRQMRRLDEVDEAHLRKLQAVYLGMIGFVDQMLGRLLQTLEDTGLAQNTVVMVFSDHGDWAGDFGLVEKWPSALDDTLTRVPFIIRAPGGVAGHVVHEPVEMFDMAATVYDLAGVEPQHTHFARSLTPQIAGATGDPNRAAFAEGGYDRHEPHCFEGRATDKALWADGRHIYYPKLRQQQEYPDSVCRTVMVRTATHKLIHRAHGVCELYDLQADPQELHNLHGDPAHAAIRAQLERRLLDWYLTTSDVTPFREDNRGLPSNPVHGE